MTPRNWRDEPRGTTSETMRARALQDTQGAKPTGRREPGRAEAPVPRQSSGGLSVDDAMSLAAERVRGMPSATVAERVARANAYGATMRELADARHA